MLGIDQSDITGDSVNVEWVKGVWIRRLEDYENIDKAKEMER